MFRSHLHRLPSTLQSGAKDAFVGTRLTPVEKTEKKPPIAAEVARLAKMTVPQLRAQHQKRVRRRGHAGCGSHSHHAAHL
jgi:hypothetical protein